jgi:hypothetical protein
LDLKALRIPGLYQSQKDAVWMLTSADVKVLAARLTQISEQANTGSDYYRIGELYGFRLLVKTENSNKEDVLFKQNRFYVEGEGNIKYGINNGQIANDPKLAVTYFLRSLEKIPSLIEKYQAENAKNSADVPVLQDVVNSTWRRENELKDLKTELAALDRKIQLSLQPVNAGEDETPGETAKNEISENKVFVSSNFSNSLKYNNDDSPDSNGMKTQIEYMHDFFSKKKQYDRCNE